MTDDRALIDAAIAAGKLRRIETGVSGLPLPKWCPEKNRLVTPEETLRPLTFGRRRGPGREIVDRRNRIREHVADRQTFEAILEIEDISENVLQGDLRALGITGDARPPRRVKGLAADLERRRAAIPGLIAAGKTRAEIAEAWNVTLDTIKRDCQALRRARVGEVAA